MEILMALVFGICAAALFVAEGRAQLSRGIYGVLGSVVGLISLIAAGTFGLGNATPTGIEVGVPYGVEYQQFKKGETQDSSQRIALIYPLGSETDKLPIYADVSQYPFLPHPFLLTKDGRVVPYTVEKSNN